MTRSTDQALVATLHSKHPNRRRPDPRLRHDAQQAVSTIVLLAEAIGQDAGLRPDTRRRLDLLVTEARHLGELACGGDLIKAELPIQDLVSLDVLAGQIVAAVADSTPVVVRCASDEVVVAASATGLWRALHNIVSNAVRAVGESGVVQVSVCRAGPWAVVEIDDDGPGFPHGPRGSASLGLGVVQDFIEAYGGSLEIGRGSLGGCVVRLRLPAVEHAHRVDLVPEQRIDIRDGSVSR